MGIPEQKVVNVWNKCFVQFMRGLLQEVRKSGVYIKGLPVKWKDTQRMHLAESLRLVWWLPRQQGITLILHKYHFRKAKNKRP